MKIKEQSQINATKKLFPNRRNQFEHRNEKFKKIQQNMKTQVKWKNIKLIKCQMKLVKTNTKNN